MKSAMQVLQSVNNPNFWLHASLQRLQWYIFLHQQINIYLRVKPSSVAENQQLECLESSLYMHLFSLIWTVRRSLHDNLSMKGTVNFNFKPVAWFSYLIITVSPNAILQLPWKNTWFLMVKCKLNITREKNSNVKKKKKHRKNDEKTENVSSVQNSRSGHSEYCISRTPNYCDLVQESKGWINNFL